MAMLGTVHTALGPSEEVTLSAAAVPGDIVRTADLRVGIVQGVGPYASGDKAPVLTMAIVELPVATGTTWAAGAAVEWDATNKLLVASSGTYKIGGGYGVKAAGPTRAKVRLNEIALA